jgi:SAM-dependent methyltransferase
LTLACQGSLLYCEVRKASEILSEISYEDRVKSQIAQYAETVNMHDLPEIFHLWSNGFIAPGLQQVFGTSSIDECYALAYMEARERGGAGRILSIGCGDGAVEIRIAKHLIGLGITDFSFVGADLSPILLGHFRAAVFKEGLQRHMEAVEADLNKIDVPGEFAVIMANHALHHIEGLEQLFAYSKARLKDGGIFATCDMIGRNGHMRWPEAEAVLQAVWPLLDPKQRYQIQLRRYEERYVNHDCSTEGFEGIRAQDILPLILESFHPYKFMAAGGFVDLLVDRGYGHGFDRKLERDAGIIRFLGNLNDMMLDAGMITPTWMMGWLTKDDCGEVFYRNRRARSSVRPANASPDWVRFVDGLSDSRSTRL